MAAPTITRRQLENARISGSQFYTKLRNAFMQNEDLAIAVHQHPKRAAETLRYLALICNQAASQYELIAEAKKTGVIENSNPRSGSENAKSK